jgi:predicted nucleotidyltransferase
MSRGYPTYAGLVQARTAKRRARALAALRLADAEARAAGGRLVVFGSLAEGGFHPDSDLDVAVLRLPPGPDLEVVAGIDTLLAREGFEADVIPERSRPRATHPSRG